MGSYQVVDCRGADEMARVERAIERAAHRGSLDEAERVEDAVERGENPFVEAVDLLMLEGQARNLR